MNEYKRFWHWTVWTLQCLSLRLQLLSAACAFSTATVLFLSYKALHGLDPAHIAELLFQCVPSPALRSSTSLITDGVQSYTLLFSNCAPQLRNPISKGARILFNPSKLAWRRISTVWPLQLPRSVCHVLRVVLYSVRRVLRGGVAHRSGSLLLLYLDCPPPVMKQQSMAAAFPSAPLGTRPSTPASETHTLQLHDDQGGTE